MPEENRTFTKEFKLQAAHLVETIDPPRKNTVS